jgi:hypothetical protein
MIHHIDSCRRRIRAPGWATALLAVVLLAAGCATSRDAVVTDLDMPALFPNHSEAQIVNAVRGSGERIQTFESRARMRFEGPEGKGAASVRFRQRRDDSLYASVRVTLGIEAARALLTPDSVFVHDIFRGKLLFGAVSDVDALVPTPTTFGELFPNLSGTLYPEPGVRWSVEADTMHYIMTDTAGLRRVRVDPRTWRVVELTLLSPEGEIEEKRTFSEFDEFDGYILPRRLDFIRPLDGTRMSIYHRTLHVNVELDPIPVVARPGLERIPISSPK